MQVPCVLQPQLSHVESLLTTIDRYFMVCTLIPPAGVAVYFAVHLVSAAKKTDAEYTPPPVYIMLLVWLFKILAPLAGVPPASMRQVVLS